MIAHNLKPSELHICLSVWDVWGCLPFALPTHILSVFCLRPIAKLKSCLSVCQMELSLSFSLSLRHQWFLFSKAHSKMALFSNSHSVAPSAGACQEVRLPKLEPGPVYTNSSEKYGCIIIEVVSFNVASLLWKPLHALSVTMRGGCWNSAWTFLWKAFWGSKRQKGASLDKIWIRTEQSKQTWIARRW